MARPYVILHNAVSLDGRIDGFGLDLAQFYGLAACFEEDASLAGSKTMFDPSQPVPEETPADRAPRPPPAPDDRRPLLVVPDSRGKVRNWHVLRQAGHWRDFVSLCSERTPRRHLDYLNERGIHVVVAGKDRVDFQQALPALRGRFGVKRVRVDSGGILNGVLLRQGLVDEVSVLVYPVIVGGAPARSIFQALEPSAPARLADTLHLDSVQALENGVAWLRYRVGSHAAGWVRTELQAAPAPKRERPAGKRKG
ncbi:MAG TPA: RibD family protein [Myxococcales bacterium]|jgi:2,5-diamino-6-(ribosylamino)-4(3H)-pyrimidinone 5'-phosphate reductase